MQENIADLILEYKQKGLSDNELERLRGIDNSPAGFRMNAQRRLFHEPFEYIQGYAEFYGRRFKVDRRCYVPDPESELLVEIALRHIPEARPSVVIDVGTGSGAIGITLAKERPYARVQATEILPGALDIALENKMAADAANFEPFQSFYVDNPLLERPDIIVSDPPYGKPEHLLSSNTPEEVAHMPPTAFFPPLGPFQCYQELQESIGRRGWNPLIILETGLFSMEEVEKNIVRDDRDYRFISSDNYSVTVIHPRKS